MDLRGRGGAAVMTVGALVGAATGGVPARAAPAIGYPVLQLINMHSHKCLVGGAVSVVQRGCAAADAFRWLFVPLGPLGRFRIENVATRRCLGVAGGSGAENARVAEQVCDDDAVTSWQLKRAAGEGDYVTNAGSGRCLTIADGAVRDGWVAVQQSCTGLAQHRWTVRLAGSLPITGVHIG